MGASESPDQHKLTAEEDAEAERLVAEWEGKTGEKKPSKSEREGTKFSDQKYWRIWLPDEVYRHLKVLCLVAHQRPAEYLYENLAPVVSELGTALEFEEEGP